MRNFQISGGGVADCGFFDQREQPLHLHADIELFYVLEGEVDFLREKESFRLEPDGFLVLNPGTLHAHTTVSPDVLYACLHLNHQELCRRLGTARALFDCNTARRRDDRHSQLQALLKKLFNEHHLTQPHRGSLYLEGLYFHLLHELVSHFLEKNTAGADLSAEDLRLGEIHGYIQGNYKNPLSLEELAEKLFLSPSYLSRYIKKHFDMNFSSYLSSVRLAHAVDELRTTQKSITRIALDNGFPNTASFTRAFKAKYGTTPSAHGEGLRPAVQSAAPDPEPPVRLSRKVRSYFENPSRTGGENPGDAVTLVRADARTRRHYTRSWNKMINIGPSGDLFNADMREHLILMRQELGFEYVRFWDLYSPVLLLDIGPHGKYNFTKLDRLFDFLVDNGMRPYIEMGFKPILLLRSAEDGQDFMVHQRREILFETPREYERFVTAFISHYSNRYGLDEVERWYFEQWMDDRQAKDGDYSPYFEMFEAAYRALKAVSPHMRLGGAGISVQQSYDGIFFDFADFLRAWHERARHPDFISIYSYPYTSSAQGKEHSRVQEQVTAIREAAMAAGFDAPVLHLSEWNFTASARNTMNDSCFKGAYIVKNVLEAMEQVEFMGYWSASDLLSEFADTNLILNGSGGLISRDGIKKPAYHAFSFLGRMGRHLLTNSENCAVTTNGYGNYTVVCHNYQRPGFKYFLKGGLELDIAELPDLYESSAPLRLQVQIEGVKNGSYTIKTHSMSDKSGSVQSEWMRMGLADNLNKQELDYLKRVCVPRISIETCEVRDGVLILDTVLEAQEIQYIHLTYRITE